METTIKLNANSQFYLDLIDKTKTMSVNSNKISKGYWNLIISIRDTGLYSRANMKPHRFWKITDVKNYFGIKGNPYQIHEQLIQIRDLITEK